MREKEREKLLKVVGVVGSGMGWRYERKVSGEGKKSRGVLPLESLNHWRDGATKCSS